MSKKAEDMIPFLTIASVNFEKDLEIVKQILGQYEKRTHSEKAYIFSPRAEMAAGWWFYDVLVTRDFLQKIFQTILPDGFPNNKKSASIKIVDAFQDQLRKNGSEARVRMHGDMPFAAPWWSWLMR
jgi:hypothetical protein